MIFVKSFLTLEKLFLFAIIFASAILALLSIHQGHNWGGDFALYISQAQAINSGSLPNLLTLNKWSMDNSSWNIGPYLYPEGFPLLISPIVRLFGVNFIFLKIFSGAFLIGSLLILYLLFRNRFSSFFYPLIILAGIGLHFELVTFSDNILSDLPFLFFCLSSFLLMEKAQTTVRKIILGAVMFYSFFTRDAGIVLLPALFIFQLQSHKKITRHLQEIIPYLVFGILWLISLFLFPSGNQNHFRLFFSDLSMELIWRNLNYYKDLATVFLIPLKINLFWIILPIISVGIIKSARNNLHIIFFIVLYFLTLLLWPIQQGIRLLFPVFPFFIFFTIQGVITITNKLKLSPKFQVVILSMWISLIIFKGIRNTISFHRLKTDMVQTKEMIGIYSYISKNVPQKAPIGFFKPTVLRFFTGNNSIATDFVHFDKSKAKYLLIPKTEKQKIMSRIVFETEQFIFMAK